MNVIEFDLNDWGGHSEKTDTPGVQVMVNGVLHTLYDVHGGTTWDNRPKVVIELRRETTGK